MALHYQTEYSVGRRGRVRRTYTGVRALIAIAFDMVLGTLFSVVELGLRLIGFVVLTAWRVSVALVTFPFKVARAVANLFERRPVAKPRYAALSDL